MKENIHEILGEATRDELFACVQLLALSVVQHRAKSGFVTFRKSMAQFRSGAEGAEEAGLFAQGEKVLEESLEMARILAAERVVSEPVSEVTTSESPAENRQQLRISITAPMKVLWPGDADPVDAKLENISWGGVAFRIDQARVDDGDTLQIILPDTRGGSISIEGKILRTWILPDGKGHGVATRFSSLSTRDETELENILELLAQSADSEGQRQYARLTHRLDIQFDDAQEFRATLDDISVGGLGVTVPAPLQIGQSLQAVISTLDDSSSLKLRARVVRQKAIKLGNVEVYHAGLKFEHPSEELKELTSELIRRMSDMIQTKEPPGGLG